VGVGVVRIEAGMAAEGIVRRGGCGSGWLFERAPNTCRSCDKFDCIVSSASFDCEILGCMFISRKVFTKWFGKSQFPHKFVD